MRGTPSLAAQALWAIKPIRPDIASGGTHPWSAVVDALAGVQRPTPTTWRARRVVHRPSFSLPPPRL